MKDMQNEKSKIKIYLRTILFKLPFHPCFAHFYFFWGGAAR